MTTLLGILHLAELNVVEACRLDGYDNLGVTHLVGGLHVVEACRLDGYDNFDDVDGRPFGGVVEACRLDGYDNFDLVTEAVVCVCCRSLSFGWV